MNGSGRDEVLLGGSSADGHLELLAIAVGVPGNRHPYRYRGQTMDRKMRDQTASLRRRAESQMALGDLPSKVNLDSIRLLHELQVHKIELELQNENLISANRELESLRARYQSLYELAPVGYLTLSMTGTVLDLNERALDLLHVQRGTVLNKPVRLYFETANLTAFDSMFRSVVEAGTEGSIDNLLVQRANTLPIQVRVQARCVKCSEFELPIVLMAMMDVSALKFALDDALDATEERASRRPD